MALVAQQTFYGTLNHAAITDVMHVNSITMTYNSNNSITTQRNAPKMYHQKYYANTVLINTGVATNMT